MEQSKSQISTITPNKPEFSTVIFCSSKSKTTVVKLKPFPTFSTSYEARQRRQSSSKPLLSNGVVAEQKSDTKKPHIESKESMSKEVSQNSGLRGQAYVKKPCSYPVCPECPELKFYDRPEWKAHMNRHKYRCEYCGKTFTRKSDFEPHIRQHRGEKPFACDLCDKKFVSASIRNCHKKIHSDKRDFVCAVCGEAFKYQAHFNLHMKKHNGEWLPCGECKKTFPHKFTLEIHRRTHTGERPFQCETCGKAFISNSKLREHKKWVHSDNGKKFMCDKCGKSFVTVSTYKDHYRIHTGDKPHFCDICGVHFRTATGVKQHKLVHNDAKLFQCDFCEKGFNRKHRKREHEEQCHKDEIGAE